jgi:sulfur carrier protein
VITVNGEPRDLAGTVDELLDAMAVAVDATVVPRGEWATTHVDDGASVEIVTAVQGG